MGDTELPNHRLPMFEIGQKFARLPGSDWVMQKLFGSARVRRAESVGLGGCFHDMEIAEGEFKSWFVDPLVADARLMRGQMNFARSVDWSFVDELPEIHGQIKAPVLMIWGEEDEVFPIQGAREMIGQFPGGARLVALPQGRLFAHEEFTEAFVAHARPFLCEIFGWGDDHDA